MVKRTKRSIRRRLEKTIGLNPLLDFTARTAALRCIEEAFGEASDLTPIFDEFAPGVSLERAFRERQLRESPREDPEPSEMAMLWLMVEALNELVDEYRTENERLKAAAPPVSP